MCKDKETAFTMKINDLGAELLDARSKSKAERLAAQVSMTWEIQKLTRSRCCHRKMFTRIPFAFARGRGGWRA